MLPKRWIDFFSPNHLDIAFAGIYLNGIDDTYDTDGTMFRQVIVFISNFGTQIESKFDNSTRKMSLIIIGILSEHN